MIKKDGHRARTSSEPLPGLVGLPGPHCSVSEVSLQPNFATAGFPLQPPLPSTTCASSLRTVTPQVTPVPNQHAVCHSKVRK